MAIFRMPAAQASKYDLNKLLTFKSAHLTYSVMPRIVCADGTTLSVQAGSALYSTPRTDRGPYSAVEVGFPSSPPPSTWDEYSGGDSNIWAYVPIELVHFYIAGHGGIDYDKTFAATAV